MNSTKKKKQQQKGCAAERTAQRQHSGSTSVCCCSRVVSGHTHTHTQTHRHTHSPACPASHLTHGATGAPDPRNRSWTELGGAELPSKSLPTTRKHEKSSSSAPSASFFFPSARRLRGALLAMASSILAGTFRALPAVILRNAHLELTVLTGGGHIASIKAAGSDVNPMWEPPWPVGHPSVRKLVS